MNYGNDMTFNKLKLQLPPSKISLPSVGGGTHSRWKR